MVDTAIEADEILDGGAAVKTGKKAAKKKRRNLCAETGGDAYDGYADFLAEL